jgi:AraC family transcriptional regulator
VCEDRLAVCRQIDRKDFRNLTSEIRALYEPLGAALKRKALWGEPGSAQNLVLRSGQGWRVVEVLCTSGPGDLSIEERYWSVAISLVLSGTFSYRSARGSLLMSPGALLLGNAGHTYQCSHEHGEGDRCLSFQFDPAMFEDLARDCGVPKAHFSSDRLPPLRATAQLTARAVTAMQTQDSFEEIALELAGAALRISQDIDPAPVAGTKRTETRIAEVLRHLQSSAVQCLRLEDLARMAGLSRYHFLRAFKSVTGVTPHQWVLRARLRDAAHRLATSRSPVTEIALDAGFTDLSNFIRGFVAEYGVSPRKYRAGP